MFESVEHTVDFAAISRARAALERYYGRIREFVRETGSSTPCSIYELSTSASPGYTQRVLEDTALASASSPDSWVQIVKLVLREVAKHAVYWSAGLIWRARHWRARRNSLREAGAIEAGFVSLRDGRASAQDFRGFTETVLHGRRVVVLARRLPQDGVKTYFQRCVPPVLPIEAHVRWSDLFSGLLAAVRLLRQASRSGIRDTHVARQLAADVTGGHMLSGLMVSRAVTRVACRYTAPAAPICLPMERHDWELLATSALKRRGRNVWAVQNCTFSPLDLNMYAAIEGAPAYRNTGPDRLFVLSRSWSFVFAALGLNCPVTVLEQHRFSGQRFTLDLRRGTRKLLYLGSINAEKVSRDLQALAAARQAVEVEIRLHPSCANLSAAAGFTRQSGFDQSYGACVFADTTMVFQLDADRSRLVFLDHPGFPNQNPATFFADWPGVTVPCDNLQRSTEALARLLD